MVNDTPALLAMDTSTVARTRTLALLYLKTLGLLTETDSILGDSGKIVKTVSVTRSVAIVPQGRPTGT